MWTCAEDALAGARGRKLRLQREGRDATVREFLAALDDDDVFRDFLNQTLAATPYRAFRWETPAVTRATWDMPCEWVTLDSPELERPPEPEAFAEHFGDREFGATSFANLRGDAVLVVPYPAAQPECYVHLATFVRRAPATQQQAFWQAVGAAMLRRVGPKPVWLSTAGAGVAWLHVRLDDRPKYYGYAPYRLPPTPA